MELLTLHRNLNGVTILNDETLKMEEYSEDSALNFFEEAKDLLIIVCRGIWDIDYANNSREEYVSFEFIRPNVEQLVIENNKLVGVHVKDSASIFYINGILLLNGESIGKVNDKHQEADSVSDPSYFENEDVVQYYLGKYPASLNAPLSIKIDGLEYFNKGEAYLSQVENLELI